MQTYARHAAAIVWGLTIGIGGIAAEGHDHTLPTFLRQRRVAQAREATVSVAPADAKQGTCRLKVKLLDEQTGDSLGGLIRIIDVQQGRPVKLTELIAREQSWYTLAPDSQCVVPRTRLKIEAVHGLESRLIQQTFDLTNFSEATVELTVRRFYDAEARRLMSANTHLHLRRLTHAEAHRYLREVPKSDDLDLVFLSHLRRIPDERDYISNAIVENALVGGELERLSQDGALLRPGQEHRHNYGRGGEGYGHVMLLDIAKLIRPVSIGPGIMGKGTDGIPLQRGIRQARSDGASVVWCHNDFGLEDLPNWMAGLLDAQNIFDGGNRGSYQDTFYRYLDLGMKVPFSTGTDWFVFDFSRVYVPIAGPRNSANWLAQLAAGKSFITNGTFLEFQVAGLQIGDTVALQRPGSVEVTARAIGRNDFKHLQLVLNGDVIHSVASHETDGHFLAELEISVAVNQPGWIAARIADEAGSNEFGRRLFAHTSPIYIEMDGRRIFKQSVARQLIEEMEGNLKVIEEKSLFADAGERESVLRVHRQGIETLRRRLQKHTTDN